MQEDLIKLVGARITQIIETPEKDFFGFTIKNHGKEYNVWVLKDPEGNGEGFLEIDEIGEMK